MSEVNFQKSNSKLTPIYDAVLRILATQRTIYLDLKEEISAQDFREQLGGVGIEVRAIPFDLDNSSQLRIQFSPIYGLDDVVPRIQQILTDWGYQQVIIDK